jgi:hypothetical protein
MALEHNFPGIFGRREDSLVTNFSYKYLKAYESAVKHYNAQKGRQILYIKPDAYDRLGRTIPESHSLHTNIESIDLSDFWATYKFIERNNL